MADEDPAGQASAKLGQHLALAAALAQAVAQLRTLRAAEQDRTDRQTAATAHAELRTRHTTDRLRWTPALNPTTRDQLDLDATTTAWTAARAWPGDPEADRAATAAESRLRELHPDAMRLYDQAVASGADPLEGMRQTQEAFDRPSVITDQPGTDRPAIGPKTHADGVVGIYASDGAAVIDGTLLAARTTAGVARESYPDPRPQLTAAPTTATAQPTSPAAGQITQRR